MRIAMTGASGFVGEAAEAMLQAHGHEVAAARRSGDAVLRWDTQRGFDPPDALQGFDAVVHLAGENLAKGRWTASRKQAIMDSRREGTRRVVEAIARASPGPRVLVSASGVSYYGDTGDREVDESSPPGATFLAQVASAWEDEARRATALGVRVVCLRFGVVLGPGGGALAKMLPFFRAGLGGRVGRGDQYLAWVHREDAVAAIEWALTRPELEGAVNVTAPQAPTNAAFTRALGRALGRPTILPVPAFGLKLAFGQMGEEALLQGQRAVPRKLRESGFAFRHPTLETALASVAG